MLDCSPDSCSFGSSFLSSFFSSFFSSFYFSTFSISASSILVFPRGFWLKSFFLLGKAKRILFKGERKMTKKSEKTIRMKKMKKATKTNKKLVTIPARNLYHKIALCIQRNFQKSHSKFFYSWYRLKRHKCFGLQQFWIWGIKRYSAFGIFSGWYVNVSKIIV